MKRDLEKEKNILWWNEHDWRLVMNEDGKNTHFEVRYYERGNDHPIWSDWAYAHEVPESIATDATDHLARLLFDLKDGVEMCHRKNPAQNNHTCPYAEEIHNDHDTECDRCDNCIHECCMEI